MRTFVRSSLAVAGLVLAGCGDDGAGSPPATRPPVTTASVTTVLATTSPPLTTLSVTTGPMTTLPVTTSSTIPAAASPVTVTDPIGDVVVATNGYGSLPNYDPRADLVSFTLSWTDVVTFSLTTAEIDPAKLEDVWVAFDTNVPTEVLRPDGSPLPRFVVFRTGSGDGLHELRDVYTLVCPVSRSIVGDTYIVEFDAACLGDAPEIRVVSPYLWSYGVTGTVTGTTSPNCGYPSETGTRPEWNCQPSATYTDEMPGTGPVVRSP